MKYFLSAFLVFSVSAYAAVDNETHFYAEPDASFSTGRYKATGEPSGAVVDISSGVSGFTPGLLLGWRAEYMHVMIGGHYSVLKGDELDGTVTAMDYGLGFGWEWNFPGMTTLMLQKMKFESEDDSGSLDGFGLRLGLALFLGQNVKLNLGYTTFNTEADEIKYTVSMVSAGISFPFDIPYPDEWWRERRPSGKTRSEPSPSSSSDYSGDSSAPDEEDESGPIEE